MNLGLFASESCLVLTPETGQNRPWLNIINMQFVWHMGISGLGFRVGEPALLKKGEIPCTPYIYNKTVTKMTNGQLFGHSGFIPHPEKKNELLTL